MAKEFEVSSRTVKRDIDFMKCRLNLPIECDSHRYGYYYTAAVEQFPSLPLSEAGTFALLFAQKAIRQYQGTPFEEPLETAYRRLIGQLNQGQSVLFEHLERGLSFRPFAPDDGDLEKSGAIYQGLSQRHQLRFRYRNLGATRTLVRHVNPYHLACVESHWYLFAYDLRREAMRTFVLTRMTDVQVTERTFPPPTDFDPNEYLKGTRLINQVGSRFYQTNEFGADDTLNGSGDENDEGALGNIRIVVDPQAGQYYVVMPGLPLAQGTFPIEH